MQTIGRTSCRHLFGLGGGKADRKELNGGDSAARAALDIPGQLHAGVTLPLQGTHKRAWGPANSPGEGASSIASRQKIGCERVHAANIALEAHFAQSETCLSGRGMNLPVWHNTPMPDRATEFTHRIKEVRKQRGLTQETLAELVGISHSHLSRMERGGRGTSLEMLARIASALSVPPNDLLVDAPRPDVTHVPVVSWVSAGRMTAREAATPRDVTRWISVADLPAGDWIALEVDGDSMNRIAPEGAIILVDRNDRQLVSGKNYVFAYDDGESTFKRYRDDPARLEPVSTNPAHDTIFPKNGLTVVGRVRRAIADFD